LLPIFGIMIVSSLMIHLLIISDLCQISLKLYFIICILISSNRFYQFCNKFLLFIVKLNLSNHIFLSLFNFRWVSKCRFVQLWLELVEKISLVLFLQTKLAAWSFSSWINNSRVFIKVTFDIVIYFSILSITLVPNIWDCSRTDFKAKLSFYLFKMIKN